MESRDPSTVNRRLSIIGAFFVSLLHLGGCVLVAHATGPYPSWPPSAQQSTRHSSPHPAVVRIFAAEAGATSAGSGTLVATDPNHGLVVTNWHVVRDATGEIEVVFPDGFRSAATVLKTDKDWDLAALLIWRPYATPIRIASMPPQPGDALTIAGYGGGAYRSVRARCTQYVAPGPNFPYEMVEVAAQAREGDSGGPILNDRQELAGVLFGAGDGTTSGSQSTRVRSFLIDIWPPPATQQEQAQVATAPALNQSLESGRQAWEPASKEVTTFHSDTRRLPSPDKVIGNPAPRQDIGQITQPTFTRKTPFSRSNQTPTQNSQPTVNPIASNGASNGPSSADNMRIDWQNLWGRTPFEQTKTLLAVIGLLTVAFQFARLSGGKSDETH